MNRRYDLNDDEFNEIQDFIDGKKGDMTASEFVEGFDERFDGSQNALARQLSTMKGFVTQKGSDEAKTMNEFLSEYSGRIEGMPSEDLPASLETLLAGQTSDTSPHKSLKDAIAKFNSDSSSNVDKVRAYAIISREFKALSGNSSRTPEQNGIYNELSAANISTDFNESDFLKKAAVADAIRPKLEKLFAQGNSQQEARVLTPCDTYTAAAWQSAASECSSGSDIQASCLENEFNDILLEGSNVARSIASLGLRSSNEAYLEDEFERLGQQRRSITCNALDTGSRQQSNGLGELEAFDRGVLGDQLYDDVMR